MLLSGAELPVAAQETQPAPQADAAIVHSGKIGTADWTIDANGVLTIGEGEFSNDDSIYSWPWRDYLDSVTRVDGTARFKVTGSLNGAFYTGNWEVSNKTIESIALSGWDTSSVTSMGDMFQSCSALTSLDVSGWDTSKVTDMSGLFSGCEALTSLDVSGWDTSKVISVGSMFSGCTALTSLDVSGWDTSNMMDMSSMFYYCSALTSLDVSGWDTSKVTDMSLMFDNCSALTSLDVSGWDTSKVTDMRVMFYYCSALTSRDVSGWDTSKVTNMRLMFSDCSNLMSPDVSGWDTSKVITMGSMFSGCSALTSLDVSGWDTSNMMDMSNMFYNCSFLTSLDVSGWDTSKVTNMRLMFSDCSNLMSLDVSGWDTSKVADMEYMLKNCSMLSEIRYSQKASSILTELPEQSGWYQNNQGPYSIADLPAVPAGQTALLTRPIPIDMASVEGIDPQYSFTGEAITPKPVVKIGDRTLAESTDYELVYSDNVDPGTASIAINGAGNYSGTRNMTFLIAEAPLSSSTVSGIEDSYAYTGSAITPKPAVRIGDRTLVEGTDYELSYSDNVNPGTAVITIKGIGNYAGTIEKTFEIAKKPDVSVPADTRNLKASIEAAEKLNSKNYTVESWNALKKALNEAKAALDSNDQKIIDSARANLDKALKALM